jgi:hypothetical protein
MASSPNQPGDPKKPREVVFEFIKSIHFRPISVDGAFGGLSPTGRSIHMTLYSERRALPKKTVHPLSLDGKLGEEIREKREVREGIIREMEVDAVMDLPTAIALRKWLTDKIQELATAQNVAVDLDKAEIKAKDLH